MNVSSGPERENRYLLRHETHNAAHYARLHPAGMSLANRLRCLNDLKRIGFQTGTGIMVGSPGQTLEHLVEDILFIGEFRPQIDRNGSLPSPSRHAIRRLSAGKHGTDPAAAFHLPPDLHPRALIPSTTALATLAPDGRERGILAGANVVMPNLSPGGERSGYCPL